MKKTLFDLVQFKNAHADPQINIENDYSKILFVTGAFKNYLDRILPILDPPPPPVWVVFIP